MATEILRPNAAGDETNLPGQAPDAWEHWDKVDEEEYNPGMPDFVYQYNDPVKHRDLYNLPAHGGSGPINKVSVHIYARRFYQDCPAWTAIKTHGVVYEGVEITLGSLTEYSTEYMINPQTVSPWTWDEIDALQIGAALNAEQVDPGEDAYAQIHMVWVEVDYTPPVVDVTLDAILVAIDSEAKVPSLGLGLDLSAPVVGISSQVPAPALSLSPEVLLPSVVAISSQALAGSLSLGVTMDSPVTALDCEALVPSLRIDRIFGVPLVAMDVAVPIPMWRLEALILPSVVSISAGVLVPSLLRDMIFSVPLVAIDSEVLIPAVILGDVTILAPLVSIDTQVLIPKAITLFIPVVYIGGEEVTLARNSLLVDTRIEARSLAEFTVLDREGLKHYQKGQPVEVYDTKGNLIFAGFIDVPEEERM